MLEADPDIYYMSIALKEAQAAFDEGEVPVGCVIVHENRIIARAHNQREMLQDPTAHAEVIALTQAAATLESWRLLDATLYVTLEPCPMCAGALVNGRVKRVVYGTRDPKAGAVGSLYDICQDERLNHRLDVTENILQPQCAQILKDFFKSRRPKKEQ